VLLWDLATGQARTLGIQRTGIARLAFTADGTALLSQDDGTAWLWDLATGTPRWGRAIPADSSPAEGRVGRRTLRGLPSGIVEEVTRGGVRDLRLADLPATAVTLIAAGPRGTALLGYADGSWGLWDLDTGARLLGGRLHGAVVGAHQEGSTLALVSELDHRETVDLAVFFVPRAELRARIDALR
jgi:WD40 repeat protein